MGIQSLDEPFYKDVILKRSPLTETSWCSQCVHFSHVTDFNYFLFKKIYDNSAANLFSVTLVKDLRKVIILNYFFLNIVGKEESPLGTHTLLLFKYY